MPPNTMTKMVAMGAIPAIKEKGLKIPEDVALIGFSNWFFSSMMDPPLSSVDQPGFEMGQEAARMLIDRIEKTAKGKDTDEELPRESKILKTRLVVRQSSLRKGKKGKN